MAGPITALKNALKGDQDEMPQREGKDWKAPPDVLKRMERGRARLKQVAARRKLAIEFTNNNHYAWLTDDQYRINQQSTVAISDGGEMPDHRVRRSHDLIGPIIKRKISTATQRIPGYEVIPSNQSEWAYLAAQVAEKVAYAGYDKWEIKRATKKMIWNALVTEEGFICARWNPSVGPFKDFSDMPDSEGNPIGWVGMGEIEIMSYGGLEVFWEPGVEFEQSRWVAIEQAKAVSQVEDEAGFLKGEEKLKPDGETSMTPAPPRERRGAKLVMVTDYFERPCPQYPQGRRLTMANGRLIFEEEPYPVRDQEGNILDAPYLHRLSYQVDAASDRNRGLVQSLIDAMRSYDMSANKIQEFIELGQVPQVMAPEGSIITPLTDEPGLVIETDPNVIAGSNAKPEWRENVQVPNDLYREREIAQEELSRMSFDTEIPASAESGKQVQAIYELNQIAWNDFIIDLADVHAALMRDCLALVQQKYSEERLQNFKGTAGWDNLAEFRGADIRGQTDVRVDPGSLEPRTRMAIEQKIANINAMFPGYFPPPVVINALNSADPGKLVETFENDQKRAYRIIMLIKTGGFWNLPPRPVVPGEEAPLVDPVSGEVVMNYATGQPFQMESVPGWMPRSFDNPDLHKQIFENWMKTSDYEELGEEEKQAVMLYYKALLDMQTKEAQRRAELQTSMAEQQGMNNAAAAQGPKALPSQPSVQGALQGSPEGMAS